jgi:hypothetical protein
MGYTGDGISVSFQIPDFTGNCMFHALDIAISDMNFKVVVDQSRLL